MISSLTPEPDRLPSTPPERGCARGLFRSVGGCARRHRRRRGHRPDVRILRLLRLRHRVGAGVSLHILPIRIAPQRNAAFIRRLLVRVHRAADRHRRVHGDPAPVGTWHQADARAVRCSGPRRRALHSCPDTALLATWRSCCSPSCASARVSRLAVPGMDCRPCWP